MIGGCAELVPVDLDPEADREEWVAARLQGIGGSDAAAIIGEHPQKSPIDVWTERVTGAHTFEDNERTIMGRILEPIVIDLFAAGYPKWPRSGGPLTVRKPPSVYHRDRPWFRGSPDGFIYDQLDVVNIAPGVDLIRCPLRPSAILEIKTHGWFGSKGYAIDAHDGSAIVSVPPDKRIQVAWYQALCQVDVAYLGCLVDTHLRRTFVIQRDLELESMLLTEVDQFWHRYVLTGEPPPPDGTDRYSKYLKGRFKAHRPELIMSTPEVELATEALIAVKRDQKVLEKNRELAEQVIKRHIGDAAGVKTALGAVTWKSQPSGKFRDKELRKTLYVALGWTDLEIAAHEAKFAQPDNRVLRTP